MRLLRILTLLCFGLAGASLLWRWLSRRQSLPCPSAFSWMVDGRLPDAIMGTTVTLERIGARPGERILEVGPGPGRLLIPNAERIQPGGVAVGIDIQPDMIRKLQAKARERGVSNLEAYVGDASSLPFAPDSFDLVYFVTVLGEVPNRAAALREAFKVLKSGGRLSITEILPDPHYQTLNAVRQLAENAGFRFRDVAGNFARYTATFIKPESP